MPAQEVPAQEDVRVEEQPETRTRSSQEAQAALPIALPAAKEEPACRAGHEEPCCSSGASSSTPARAATPTTPLTEVVKEAVERFFADTLSQAAKGDARQQALLSQMLLEGYGCAVDVEKSRLWSDKARRRGARAQGVYCAL